MPDADLSAAPPDPMAADPNIGAGIGNAANDPGAEMPAEDPTMGGMEDGAEDQGMPSGDEGGIGDDSTASIIDQLSDDDKEAVRNYAESLLNRDETSSEGNMDGMEEPAAPAPGQEQGVMMEITKGRLKKVQKVLKESFKDRENTEERPEKVEKKVNVHKKKSPFDSPLY